MHIALACAGLGLRRIRRSSKSKMDYSSAVRQPWPPLADISIH